MQFTTLSALLLPALASAGRFTIPTNLADGHYSSDGSIDATTGAAKLTLVATIDYSLLPNTTAEESEPTLSRRSNWGPYCNGRPAPGNTKDAQYAFANHWDNVRFTDRLVMTYVGSAIGYACNYGGEQVVHKSDYLAQMGTVDATCGAGNAGWFSNYDNWKLNYGRDDIRQSVC